MKRVLETSEAIAQGVMLCNPDVVPMYPITPQTHIVERIADYINDGELSSLMIHAESEHSAISCAVGVSAAGSRVFTATASQGLALMHEILFIVSSLRLPVVMGVANRALSGPINIWNDHQDSVSARDTGWIQLYCESSQEALDTTIMAYKIAEHSKVMLPVMVCVDGFTLSHVYEPVDIPEQAKVDSYLPKFKPAYVLDPKKPITVGPIAFPNSYMNFKQQQHDALIESIKVIDEVNEGFEKEFGRSYGNGLIESYKMEGAEYAIVAMGSVCGTARNAVDELQKNGKKVGMIKIKSYRPFPKSDVLEATKELKGIAIIDKNLSTGFEGALYTEMRSALYGKDIIVNGYIMGLGGRDITMQDIAKLATDFDSQKEMKWVMETETNQD